jgi:hypothetical protein
MKIMALLEAIWQLQSLLLFSYALPEGGSRGNACFDHVASRIVNADHSMM